MAATRFAKEIPSQTLQPTALVHEAYLRLVGSDENWESRAHFLGAAARSMRQILVNRAVQKQTKKHGGNFKRHELHEDLLVVEPPPDELLMLDEALTKLEQFDEMLGKIVMLRYFAGLSIKETAKTLDRSTASINRDWRFARAWLTKTMTDESRIDPASSQDS